MIKSMTGFGKGVAEADGQKVTVEIKSVNHRFLDINAKLPKALSFAEDIVRARAKEALVRGHLDVYVTYEDLREDGASPQFDYALAGAYCEAAKTISEKYSLPMDIGSGVIMRLPGIICERSDEKDEETLSALLVKAVDEALNALNVMRQKEGGLLAADMLDKLAAIEEYVSVIEAAAPNMVAQHRQKLSERIKDALGDVAVDEARLLNEIAFYSDKVCVDEETSRLKSHTTHFADVLKEGGAVGKKLDFIIQEMNRESNTIGSKCCDIEVSGKVIALKCEIEKMREQVQNME